MDLDLVVEMIDENGYLGLFLWLCCGVFIPIPNEVILMTVGFASSQGALTPVPAFLVTYLGIAAAFTLSYLLGRLIGRRLLSLIYRKKRLAKSVKSAMRLMDKYHMFSLSLSCFVPGARYFVPLLYGISRLSFRKFAIFAYSGAFVWVLIIFVLGYLFGDKMELIMKYSNEMWLWVAVLAAASLIIIVKVKKKKWKSSASEVE
ncbi:DedA family protein [Mesobacillus stamsii]|uniref:Membrane protein DedA with SNARE-associated domain n=1 Tax=Mesobacillus stamsii TaxID=225347 RepID=A0ABU0FTX3_9BACI|nr:DedA family protein [Mesobacillus stamsii]MDQ0412767.1 membrane protein DedA with SNARE-associated domain [Mesobacillus stamsii]